MHQPKPTLAERIDIDAARASIYSGSLAGHAYWRINAAGKRSAYRKRARGMEREPVLMLLRNFATTGAGIGAVVRVIGYRVFRQQGKEWARVNVNSPPNYHPGAQPSH
jgi:hypothetical protein